MGSSAFAQNERDSIHLVLHENQNGTLRTLDTIVPISEQQALFVWMNANGWDAPPPPPPIPGQPMMFEQEIVIDGDSSSAPNGQRVIIIEMEGDAGAEAMPPLPPLPPAPPLPPGAPIPPGQCKMVIIEDGKGPEGNGEIMRHPMPPPPGSDVQMTVVEKDTVINGETRKMIIRTERIILPAKPPVPPTPSGNDKKPIPAKGKRDLVFYPNPANSIITVEFDIAAKEKTTLQVIDMNGKVVYTEEIVDEQGKHITREINLSGKGKGAYTVEVKSNSKMIAERIILQ